MMTYDDYKAETLRDAIDWMDGNAECYKGADFDDVWEALWLEDTVTGNASGSYTFNAWRAAENVGGVIFDDDFISDLCDLGSYDHVPVEEGPEACDVLARVCALEYNYGELEAHWAEIDA